MVQRHHGFFQRRVGIEAVGIEDVDVGQAEAFQARIQARDQRLARAPFAIGTRPHIVASLGGNDHFISVLAKITLHDVSKMGLSTTGWRTIIVGQIEMSNTSVKGLVKYSSIVFKYIYTTEIMPKAQ